MSKYVCVEVLRHIQSNGVMSSAVSLPVHTFTGHAYSSMRSTSIVHIFSPETGNCPSWIRERERMTIENISWSNLHESMLPTENVEMAEDVQPYWPVLQRFIYKLIFTIPSQNNCKTLFSLTESKPRSKYIYFFLFSVMVKHGETFYGCARH